MNDYNASMANITSRIASIESRFGIKPPVTASATSAADSLGSRTGGSDATGSSFGTLVDRLMAQTTKGGNGASTSVLNDLLAANLDQQNRLAGSFDSNRAVTIARNPVVTQVQGSGSQASSDGVGGEEIVRLATQFLGIPYVWGGEDPSGFDCSGLVQHVYEQAGISLPRVARDQARVGIAVPSLEQALPGDLVAFGDPVDHIGIYAGGGKMVVAPRTGDVVKIQDITRTPVGIRRILVPPTTAVGSANEAGTRVFIEAGRSAPAAINAASATTTVESAEGDPSSSTDPAANYRSMFQQSGEKYGVSPQLLEAVAKQESQFNQNAQSPAGAQGLMQIMPSTAKALKVDPFDPAQAIDGSAKLLSQHLRQFGSVSLALAAYNAGPGAVQKFGGVPPYRETQGYVSKIMTDLSRRLGGTTAQATALAAFAPPRPLTASEVPTTSTDPTASAPTGGGVRVPVQSSATGNVVAALPASAAAFTLIASQIDAPATTTSTSSTNPISATNPASATISTTIVKPTGTTATAVPTIVWPTGTPVGPTTGAWGPNTQMQVRGVGGDNTVSWGEAGLLAAASPEEVKKYAPTATGPVAKGVLRSLQNATAIQMRSREFRQTLNDVNRDALGLANAPDVIPIDPPAPAVVVTVPATATAASTPSVTGETKPLATVLTGPAAVPPTSTPSPSPSPSPSPKSV